MSVLAIIPARAGSKGIPSKNFELLGEESPLERAISCTARAGIHWRVVTTDRWPLPFPSLKIERLRRDDSVAFRPSESVTRYLCRPPELAQDDTPMIDVVKHVFLEIPGPDDQIVVLLQPTQPLRKPEHVTAAIDLLQTSGADSVVSVLELPLAQSPDLLLRHLSNGTLCLWHSDLDAGGWCPSLSWGPTRRQQARPAYQRDGTVYAFRRSTVMTYGHVYGERCVPLLIDPKDSAPLDTSEDWLEAERRLKAREA